jgi:putative transposase
VNHKSDHGAGAPTRRAGLLPTRGGPPPRPPPPFRHLAHLPSFRNNPIVFFTTCTYHRHKILASPHCQKILHEIRQRSADHDGWWVGNYILMPDHVHFFARPEIDAQPMADWVKMWKSVSSRRIAAALSIKSPIWQSEYFDRYLRSTENYAEKWHYVEQNAVRAGLVETAESWPYRGAVSDLMF